MNAIKVMRYTAVILGFQASAFFLFFLISEGAFELLEGKASVIPILLMMMMAVGGFVWAILKAGIGGLLMIAGGFIMAVYLIILGGIGEYQMALIFGLPFIIPGLIFYFLPGLKRSSFLKI